MKKDCFFGLELRKIVVPKENPTTHHAFNNNI